MTEQLLSGRYRLEELLGRGGMGEVHRAVDTQLGGRSVAVKRLLGGASEETLELLRKEGVMQANIRDKRHVVEVYDVVEEDGSLFVVMEYVEGGVTLADLIVDHAVGSDEGDALSIAEAVRYFEQACSGLASVHANGVLHGDIKSFNFLITPAKVLKLTDFGLSRVEADAQTTQAFGTARNTAPEVFDGELAPASDVYALGYTFYELFLGRELFAGEFPGQTGAASSPASWTRWHLDPNSRTTPASARVPELPDAVSDVLARMMEKDKEARITLEEALEQLGQAAPAGSAPAAPRNAPQTNSDDTAALVVGAAEEKQGIAPWMLWAGGGLVLLLVVVFVFATGGKKDGDADDETAGPPPTPVLGELAFETADGASIDLLRSGGRTIYLADGNVTLHGRLQDAAEPSVVVRYGEENLSLDLDEDGVFTGALVLATEATEATVVVSSPGMNSPIEASVIVDAVAPQLTIGDVPKAVGSRRVDLALSVRDDHLASLTVGGEAVAFDEDGSAPAASAALSAEGENTIEIVAIDHAGNETRESVRVMRDTTGPVLGEFTPAPESVLEGEQEVTVTLRFDEPVATALLGLDTALEIFDGGLRAEGTLILPDMNGAFTDTWRATDAFGNSTSGTFTWQIDSVWGDIAKELREGIELVDREAVRDASGRYPRVIRHLATGIEFIYVPEDSFTLGDMRAGDNFGWRGMIQRRVVISGFYMARTETSLGAWERGGGADGSAPAEDHPVGDVSWSQALGWCLQNGFDLPSEAQWEYAASGSEDLTYPWGPDFVDGFAHFGSGTAPVASLAAGASWCGVLDLAGNVWEWCKDGWNNGYAAIPVDTRDPLHSGTDGGRVVRGGGFEDAAPDLASKSWFRRQGPAGASDPSIGFRAVFLPRGL